MFHHGHAFGGVEDDISLPALDEFEIQEFSVRIEFGDKSVVIGSLRLTVDARDEIALLDGIIHEAIGRLEFRHGNLGAEWADDHKGYGPDQPGGWMADDAYQKGHYGGGVVHKVDGSGR